MANAVKIEMDQKQLDKIVAKLQSIDRSLDLKEMSPMGKALAKCALMLETSIKKAGSMPVVTGRLRSSVHAKLKNSEYRIYKNSKGEVFEGSLKEPVEPGKMLVVGTNVEYAHKMDKRYGFMAAGMQAERNNIKNELREVVKYSLK